MGLMKRIGAAIAAFNEEKRRSDYEEYLANRADAKRAALHALETQPQFVAIMAINTGEPPGYADMNILRDGLRELKPHQRIDAMQAITDACPKILLNNAFRELASEPDVLAALKARYPKE